MKRLFANWTAPNRAFSDLRLCRAFIIVCKIGKADKHLRGPGGDLQIIEIDKADPPIENRGQLVIDAEVVSLAMT